ncbi:[NiFe] hydrogenase nickel incorporation-associated protein HypB [hydrothermal vent metagenome]|uniref:[NiFe] hydrogenase nickel incorporation-associated protein HypB n=1 Tax=hydrothermal vent metagenome TaxID=652676 RepID=A0A3B0S8P1_9ZZZZ
MCGTCGCSDGNKATIIDLQTGEHTHIDADGNEITHSHDHDHDHGHAHTHAGAHGTTIALEQAIMQKNDALAARNRAWFNGREILALNLVSSPGSGKTSILERTIVDLKGKTPISVIEGDQQTANDAQRIKDSGAPSVQINTGTGCHLEADMVMSGLKALKPSAGSIVMIENVGNLVCPALFDLGEAAKVAILSVTEGEDKPIKYPHMFQASDVMLLNKTDLLPHLDFDVDQCMEYARQVNPNIKIIQVSAKTGEGMDDWYSWLEQQCVQAREQAFA